MDIVVSHNNVDFDALASQVAVTKLFPGTIRVGQGLMARNVRDFLALHKDCFELTPLNEINLDQVDRLFVVDVRRRSRLRPLAPLFERQTQGGPPVDVHIYDHHGPAPDDIEGTTVHVESLGAATTMLVEELQRQAIAITPVEATLFALGIYSDTGSLTYPSTTPRDAAAATYLLTRGASLSTLRYFLHAPLEPLRRRVMVDLLNNAEEINLDGVRFGLTQAPLTKRTVNGLSEVVNDVLTLEPYEALFALFPRRRQVTVVGRSQVPYVDIGNIMLSLGGGGHPGAGSAVLKETDPDKARQLLLQRLEESPPSPSLVRHLMTTPVHTVPHDQPLEDAHEEFLRRNISGAPVLKNERLVGIISKRDIRAACRGGRDQLPVASCMAHSVKTIGPDEPLIRAFEQMVEADIGRLPVLEMDRLIGIVTRSDALRVLYPDRTSTPPPPVKATATS
jgi:tRNA nucleotidyltransferase (CCA-adding enzyme)